MSEAKVTHNGREISREEFVTYMRQQLASFKQGNLGALDSVGMRYAFEKLGTEEILTSGDWNFIRAALIVCIHDLHTQIIRAGLITEMTVTAALAQLQTFCLALNPPPTDPGLFILRWKMEMEALAEHAKRKVQ